MKKIILLWVIILLGNIIYGQSHHYPETLQKIAVLKGEGAIINIKTDYQIPAAHFFEKYQLYFGLGNYDEMREIYSAYHLDLGSAVQTAVLQKFSSKLL